MLKRFKSFIEAKKLFTPQQNVLLAISGGVDSMVMVNLFLEAGYTIAIAHLNHMLRGSESDGDADFVKNFAHKYKILYFQKEVNIAVKVISEKRNLQELAREERYRWFEEICRDNDLQLIATAHHQDDEIESFLFNFSRNSGLKGLSGITSHRENIIRPMLFTNRFEILDYARIHNIAYREDSSNVKTKYRRNFIRHEVIPKLIEMNPGFIENAAGSISKLKNTRSLFEFLIGKYKKELVEKEGSIIKIKLIEILSMPQSELMLYEIISEYGYNFMQVEDIIRSKTIGSLYYSETHRAVLDRYELIIENKSGTRKVKEEIIESTEVDGFGSLILNDISYPEQFESNPNLVHMDKKLLKFPLTLRNWEPGDYFQPLGMEGSQKVKDFLTNNKVDRFQKDKSLVLCSGEQICWLVGWRMDDNYKLTDSSERVLRVEWRPFF